MFNGVLLHFFALEHAERDIAIALLSVCSFVCLFCVKTAKPIVKILSLTDSAIILV